MHVDITCNFPVMSIITVVVTYGKCDFDIIKLFQRRNYLSVPFHGLNVPWLNDFNVPCKADICYWEKKKFVQFYNIFYLPIIVIVPKT